MKQQISKKVLVGISGGVDSAVAASLLLEQGYQVVGAFMRNWDSTFSNDFLGNPDINAPMCPQEQDYEDALAVAKGLNIELLRVDFIKEYWDEVFIPFIKEYQAGRTPNPDIYCNKYIKFKYFLDFALKNGFDFIATGHYADKVFVDGKWFISKADDASKDQSYFLAQLNHEQIEKALFPLAKLKKQFVRDYAKKHNIIVANKKDSTGICFIGERDFAQFLKNYIKLEPGPIIEKATNLVLGQHKGAYYYTKGQRKGLSIGGIAGRDEARYFVVDKDVVKNIVFVSAEKQDLYCNYVVAEEINLLVPLTKKQYKAQFRYHQVESVVSVTLINDKLHIVLAKAQQAISLGQQAVIYDDDIVVASGIICEVKRASD